jgi:hypothetical protein
MPISFVFSPTTSWAEAFQDVRRGAGDPLADCQHRGRPARTAHAVNASTATRACRIRVVLRVGHLGQLPQQARDLVVSGPGMLAERSRAGGISDDASAGTVFHSDHGA